ncbi:family 20 glycosylhydrolase [Clostridium perfringens]
MRVKLVGLNEEMLEAVKGLEELIDFQLYNEKGSKNENLEIINVSKLPEESENVIEVLRGKNNEIRYKKKHHFFRAFSLYLQFLKKGEESFSRSEKTYIDSVGVMIDASRNAVYRVSEVKRILGYMALMGHNRCMLYTEDTYEIEGYPYFGYMRGRYSKEELREIDNYGYSLGIEVVPCIQTLAHLKQTLRWPYGEGMKDTQDVLLVGEEKTYKFIEAMISSLRECFRSKNIHIGMDEAFDLGRGHYLTKHGHVPHQELMVEHLNKVNEIAKKYDFKPMIWDDMFLRCGAPDGGYYDLDIVITPEIANNIPEEVSLVYWDYYNSNEEKYKKLLDIRDNFNNNIIFAGGCWRWSGFAPNYSKTFETTNAALNQCKAKGINEVFATAWGDDGSETPIYSIIVGLILFAEHGYYDKVDKEWIDERCKALTGLSMEDFTSLEELDLVPSVKSEIGLEIRKAYLEKDKDALRLIAYNFIPEIQEKLKSFHKSFRDLWYKECKGQGFEVIDIRLGGVMARCDSTMYRIKAYLKGNIDKIEELEEERLYFSEHFGGDDCKLICCNEYQKIATQNILSW